MPRSSLRWCGIAIGLAGGLTVAGPRSGRAAILLWLPRLLAQAWAPVVAVAGILVGGAALAAGRCVAGLAALAGAMTAARFTVRTLGSGTRLAPVVAPRMPDARCLRDVVVGDGAGSPLLGDLWLPADGTPSSGVGVVYLHGGLWQALAKACPERITGSTNAECNWFVSSVVRRTLSLSKGSKPVQLFMVSNLAKNLTSFWHPVRVTPRIPAPIRRRKASVSFPMR